MYSYYWDSWPAFCGYAHTFRLANTVATALCPTVSPVPASITLRISQSSPKLKHAPRLSTSCATHSQSLLFICHVSCNSLCLLRFPDSIALPSVAAYLLAPLDRIMFTLYKLNWRAWRLSMFINLIPGILSIIILVFLPESAKFLLFVGKDKLAYETVDRLYKLKRKRDLASIGITAINDPDSPVKLKEKSNCCIEIWRDTVPLFKRPYVANFMICSIILCGILFVWVRLNGSLGSILCWFSFQGHWHFVVVHGATSANGQHAYDRLPDAAGEQVGHRQHETRLSLENVHFNRLHLLGWHFSQLLHFAEPVPVIHATLSNTIPVHNYRNSLRSVPKFSV